MAIELTPIFFKLMLIKSPYDYLEENIKELIKAENGIEIKANYYQDKEGHERDLVINHQVMRLLKEKATLTRQLATRSLATANDPSARQTAERIEDQAELDERYALAIEELLQAMPIPMDQSAVLARASATGPAGRQRQK